MELGYSNWKTFDDGIQKEYLITNGLGSFCSSTIIGANIRKYHGLLNASLEHPIKRYLLLSKIDETLKIEGEEYKLFSNQFIEKIDDGYLQLRRFNSYPIPKFIYGVKDVIISKELAMEYEKNTVAVVYKINTGSKKVKMTFTPYINFRNHHDVSKKGSFKYNQSYERRALKLIEKSTGLNLKIISNCIYEANEEWSLPMFYENENYRGLESIDFHFIPGIFYYEMEPHKKYTITFLATIEDSAEYTAEEIIENEKKRRIELIDRAGYTNRFLNNLVLASDSFIVRRSSTKTKTIIAGYPWFTDWGRDTMIAFTGLTLTTKRFDDAKNILLTFIKYIKYGIIPNMFPDENTPPLYNTADGSLWFFYAVYKYLKYTNDLKTIKDEIYPHLEDMIKHHVKGTINNIYMDDDGLLSAGDEGTQLTWMDVKVGDWVVTPRHGKAVEINALWYNALKIMEEISNRLGYDGSEYGKLAEKAKKSFVEKFWNDKGKYLYDVIQDKKPVDMIRPNQILAVSLPFSILDREKEKLIVEKVHEELYTPFGLRSLSKRHKEYIGKYGGDVLKRDGAYHQGTVWAWLIGPFVEAYVKVNNYSKESKLSAKYMLEEFYYHMKDACISNISEIFDGDKPHYPRGCVAQAWSVGEVLRTYVEVVLNFK
ncbi:glycogen debranching enzyme, putative [Caminicella sporogenes DSM 14501]|uniref:Glycogen debranching enzyme, putative n=1 Tax=Caminicella sporogenes DSM 14501 TaxID=1121266 RepID=A0A1M6N279_9FIRM|nr:amylo-alpha-1,6-glucosidase [Caminicella sporogenes]RKD22394.1 glycogen debranching protein [Caminicella sporogenes]SHJ89807.1 glycogen debranching enzyme, putative [Caminicella sporogenes DSM 14501]